MAKKTNWDKIQAQDIGDSAKARDVYGEQQMDRQRLGTRKTMASVAWIPILVTVLAIALVWWIVGSIEQTGAGQSINIGATDFFYGKRAERSNFQYVTLRDVKYLFEEDGVTPLIDKETHEQAMEFIHTRYILNKSTGVLIDVQSDKWPIYNGTKPYILDESTGQYLTPEYPEDYDYTEGLPKDEVGNPIIPRIYRKLNAPEGLDSKYYLGRTHVNTDGDVYLSDVLETYIDYNNRYGDADDVKIDNAMVGDWLELAKHGFALLDNGDRRYKLYYGKLFESAGLLAAKQPYDPAPTPLKLIVAIIVGGLAFGALWMVLSKNLDAQNVMTDTSDINQHYNDQFIALPEEIQKAYDIFPDVGAHSTVMVSSMISHQMLTNKGLKKVKLARRAKKDILDEDGDVAIYKGDILRDDKGEPICDEVPLIDNEFSEALFDSSKTPKGKNIDGKPTRRYFDAPKIPYNPGNESLDKLKDYDTVAELINKDWTFPVYEPQRPGGMYIVDTAPVNTMVENEFA